MINMGMRDDNLLYLEFMPPKNGENVVNVVPRIDDHGLVRSLVPNNRAVALEWPDREDFVDHKEAVSTQPSAFSPTRILPSSSGAPQSFPG
jgi:hypothetical protein